MRKKRAGAEAKIARIEKEHREKDKGLQRQLDETRANLTKCNIDMEHKQAFMVGNGRGGGVRFEPQTKHTSYFCRQRARTSSAASTPSSRTAHMPRQWWSMPRQTRTARFGRGCA